MRPISDPRHQAMLDGIVMDVVDVPAKVGFVADRVLPKTALPDGTLAAMIRLGWRPSADSQARESGFDFPPAPGEVRIAFRQGHDRVQVVRKDDDCIDIE